MNLKMTPRIRKVKVFRRYLESNELFIYMLLFFLHLQDLLKNVWRFNYRLQYSIKKEVCVCLALKHSLYSLQR